MDRKKVLSTTLETTLDYGTVPGTVQIMIIVFVGNCILRTVPYWKVNPCSSNNSPFIILLYCTCTIDYVIIVSW